MVRAGGNHSGRGWMNGWMYYCSVEDPILMRVQLLLVDAMQINGEECSITVVQPLGGTGQEVLRCPKMR